MRVAGGYIAIPLFLRTLIKSVLRPDGDPSMGARVATGSLATFAIKVAYSGSSFLVTLLLSRYLGATGLGAYTYALAWVTLLLIVATLGLDSLLTRDIAAYQVKSAWGEIRSLLRQTTVAVFLVSVGLSAAVVALSGLFVKRSDPQTISTLWIALLLLPMMAIGRLGQAVLQGLHHVGSAQVPAMVVQPVLLAVLLFGSRWFVPAYLTASWAMKMHVVAAGCALLVLGWLLIIHLPEAVRRSRPVPLPLTWFRSILPLIFLASITTIYTQANILLLGAFKGTRVVGIYGIADRSAQLIAFFLMTVNPALAPVISSLYAARKMEQLQRIVTKSARWTFIACLPLALCFLFLGRWYLLLVFGKDFAQGQTALAILTFGQLMNVATGSVGYLLIMTGHEREAAKGMAVSALINVGLNAALVPTWGMEGAATAGAVSMILANIWFSVVAYRKLGIHSTAFGRLGSRTPGLG